MAGLGLPVELFGLPVGVVIIALVAELERAKLVPSQYAGVVAILIATLGGTVALLAAAPLPLTWLAVVVAIGKAAAWGVGIVCAHNSVINPIKNAGA